MAKYMVSTNREFVNKVSREDMGRFNRTFVARSLSDIEIMAEICEGFSIGPVFATELKEGYSTTRNKAHWLCTQMVCLDFDDHALYTNIADDEFVKQYASFVYTTPSHTDTDHRCRAIFLL